MRVETIGRASAGDRRRLRRRIDSSAAVACSVAVVQRSVRRDRHRPAARRRAERHLVARRGHVQRRRCVRRLKVDRAAGCDRPIPRLSLQQSPRDRRRRSKIERAMRVERFGRRGAGDRRRLRRQIDIACRRLQRRIVQRAFARSASRPLVAKPSVTLSPVEVTSSVVAGCSRPAEGRSRRRL